MKLFFINPPGPRYLYRGTICTYISKARYVWKPKDFILLSSVVPPDWEVQFIDGAINRLTVDVVLQRVQDAGPDVAVVALSSINWQDDLAFLKSLRDKLTGKRIVIFGEALIEPALANEALKHADGMIYDPLRSPFTEIATGQTEGRTTFVRTKKTTQKLVTHVPRHTLFDNKLYRWPFVKRFRFASVYTQFGCPFVCSYCTEAITNVTYRAAENVLEEMAVLKKLGYRELQIGDASFGYPRENARQILQGMVDQKFGFSWSSYTYPGLIDLEMLTLMAKSGCHTVVIGVDSADGALLEKYGRHLPQGKIRDFIANCRKLGIAVCGDIIIGFEEDTRESCLASIELAIEMKLDFASFNIAAPVMGSSFREQRKMNGAPNEQNVGFDGAGLSKVSSTKNLSSEDLVALRNYAVKRFYMRPSYFWKQLTGVRNPEEIFIKMNEGFGIISNMIKQERSMTDGYN